MSVARVHTMNETPETREPQRDAAPGDDADDEAQSSFWFWFALGVLMFCWIAEATMCAERGF
jgi:hypothetical protein